MPGGKDNEDPLAASGSSQQTFRSITAWSLAQISWQVVAFVLLGMAIDHWVGTSPWGILTCSMLGLVSMVYSMIRLAAPRSKMDQDDGSTC